MLEKFNDYIDSNDESLNEGNFKNLMRTNKKFKGYVVNLAQDLKKEPISKDLKRMEKDFYKSLKGLFKNYYDELSLLTPDGASGGLASTH